MLETSPFVTATNKIQPENSSTECSSEQGCTSFKTLRHQQEKTLSSGFGHTHLQFIGGHFCVKEWISPLFGEGLFLCRAGPYYPLTTCRSLIPEAHQLRYKGASCPLWSQITGTQQLPMGLSPDQEAKRANMPCNHCSPTSQAEQCLGKGNLSGKGKGGAHSEEALLPHQTWWDASSEAAQPPSKVQF